MRKILSAFLVVGVCYTGIMGQRRPAYDSEPFEVGRDSLPAGYSGNDFKLIYDWLAKKPVGIRPREGESLNTQLKRLQTTHPEPLSDKFNLRSTFAFSASDLTTSYDPTRQKLKIIVPISKVAGPQGDSYSQRCIKLMTVTREDHSRIAMTPRGARYKVRVHYWDDYYVAVQNWKNLPGLISDKEAINALKLPGPVSDGAQALVYELSVPAAEATSLSKHLRLLCIGNFDPVEVDSESDGGAATPSHPVEESMKSLYVFAYLIGLMLYDQVTGKVYRD